jgi:flagellar biosynthesis/type III secretory pathway M-ring protein FliF/YscJ
MLLLIILDFMWPNGTLYGFVYSLSNQMMVTRFRFSNATEDNISDIEKSNAQDVSSGLPAYAIALIAICCTAFLIIAIFVFHRRFKRNKPGSLKNNSKSKARMQAVWSNPENLNICQLIVADKKERLHKNSNDLNNRDCGLKGSTNIEFES